MPAPACQRVGIRANGPALAELALQWPALTAGRSRRRAHAVTLRRWRATTLV